LSFFKGEKCPKIINKRRAKMPTVLFFGRLKEITGRRKMMVRDIKTLSQLKNLIFERYPELRKEHIIVSLNREIATEDKEINEGDEIAFIPPMTGG